MKKLSIAACVVLCSILFNSVSAAEIIRVYGPGGPLPAVKEAATAFEKKTGIKVEVTGGPTPANGSPAHAKMPISFTAVLKP